jgi:hypothetical protein
MDRKNIQQLQVCEACREASTRKGEQSTHVCFYLLVNKMLGSEMRSKVHPFIDMSQHLALQRDGGPGCDTVEWSSRKRKVG